MAVIACGMVDGVWKISRRGAIARVWKLSHWVMWKFGCGMYCIISIQKLPHSWHVFNNREYVGGCGGYGVAVSTRQQVVRELPGYAVGRGYAVGGIIVGSSSSSHCVGGIIVVIVIAEARFSNSR